MVGVKAVNAIFQFIILAVLARILSPSEFGLMGLAMIVVNFSNIFNDLGFGPAITQKDTLNTTDVHTSFTYSIIFGIILIIILWALAPIISEFFKNKELTPILRAISVVLLLKSLTTTPLGLLYREMEFKKLSIIQIVSYVIGYGSVGITLAFLGLGVWSLVIAVLSQSVIAAILYLFFSREQLGFSFNRKSFKELIHFGGGYSLTKIFSFAATEGDKIIVGRILGAEALGLYERGFQVVKYTSSLIGEIIDKVLFSPIARKQNDKELVGEIFIEITYLSAFLFLPFSMFLFNFATHIVHILLGSEWDKTITIVQIMSVSVFFLISTIMGSTVVKSLGDIYRRALRTFFYSIYIIVAVYLGSRWGLVGATLAVSIGTIINYFLAFTQVHYLTGLSYLKFFKSHVLGFSLVVSYQLLFFLVTRFLSYESMNEPVQLVVGAFLLLIVYMMGFFLDYRKVLRKYFKAVMESLGVKLL